MGAHATEFRILHISDLHFGNHNEPLAGILGSRVAELKPHVIVATGDIADSPNVKRLREAKTLLQTLENNCVACASPDAPKLIVVPGNHDKMFLGNVMVLRNPFRKVFGDPPRSAFYPEERIWIYAMDSARARIFGANGFVPDMELKAFLEQYADLKSNYSKIFPDLVFKIIALHHHPLPVNEASRHSELQRWLTLMNAGALLGTALTYEVDLILHGHEHVDARSVFSSSLGGPNRELHVISVGASLREGDANYMNLVVLGPERQVEVQVHKTVGIVPKPVERHIIRSLNAARDKMFDKEVKDRGYHYREVVSTTILNGDGDCRRIVECEGLDIRNPIHAKPYLAKLELPATTGDIDLDALHLRGRGRLAADAGIAKHSVSDVDLRLGDLVVASDYGFEYSWWALNAFAMDEHQYLLRYGVEDYLELTHLHITDPIEDLTLVARFPVDREKVQSLNLQESLFPCVTYLGPNVQDINAKRNAELELELREAKALRFVESLDVVALRVHRPVIGYSYGIGWRVAPVPPESAVDAHDVLTWMDQVRERWRNSHRTFMRNFFVTVANQVRGELLPKWTGEVELSIVIYQPADRTMSIVATGVIENGAETVTDLTGRRGEFRAPFGAGVGGRAFKNNRPVLWQKRTVELHKSPDFYRRSLTGMDHEFLVAFPLRSRKENLPYGVLCVGSTTEYPFNSAEIARLDVVQRFLSDFCFELLDQEARK
jgi:predicted phosphodiesterase